MGQFRKNRYLFPVVLEAGSVRSSGSHLVVAFLLHQPTAKDRRKVARGHRRAEFTFITTHFHDNNVSMQEDRALKT